MRDEDSRSNTNADKFVMLFSSDWFRPYWQVTGFEPRSESGDVFQQEMRSQVGVLIGDAGQYWLVSFTNARLDETRAAFLESIQKHAAADSNLRLIEGDVQSEASAEIVTDISASQWANYECLLEQLANADLESTEWDRYLVQLTPDLPDLLQNFALQIVRHL